MLTIATLPYPHTRPFNYTDWTLDLTNQRFMTDVLLPQLERLTPGGGAYLSEADFRQPDWQRGYGEQNYERLRAIKDRYDPDHVFYALTGVGSEEWTTQTVDGTLCRTGSGSDKEPR